MFENRSQKVVSFKVFIRRMVRQGFFAGALVAVALSIGVLGYHILESLPWIDSLLNASMILGGMGPVDQMHTNAGKIFASAYAIFSGIVFIALMAMLLAPLFHRMMHKFHVADR